MPASTSTITNVAPASANPGDQITLTGTGFVAGAVVAFAGNDSIVINATAPHVVSATHITAIVVPDFGGDAMALAITVANPDEDPCAPATLALNAWPPVEAIFPLIGLSALKRALGLGASETDVDDRLRQLIQIASAQLMRIVTFDMQPVTLTGELYDGDDSPILYLRRAPVVSVSACSIDGQAVDVSTLKVYPEYVAFDDSQDEYNPRLRSMGQIFGRGRLNVSVTYTAGLTAVPRDLSDGCGVQVAFLQNTLGKEGVISDQNSQINATTQYSQLPVAPAARIAANRYRKQGMRAV